jgi:superfamily II DNA/RNA helicase
LKLNNVISNRRKLILCLIQGGAATVAGLEQGYVVCPSEKRFLLLFTFLKKNRKKKAGCILVNGSSPCVNSNRSFNHLLWPFSLLKLNCILLE